MSRTRCPECGDEKERIAQHWAMSSCGYPDVSDEQRAVLDGLVLSGATITGNGSNRHLTVGTTNEHLAAWTADRLGWLCHGVRTESHDGDREDVYRVRTPAHPAINRYERWAKLPENSGRAPPERFALEPDAARVWWAYAGGLEWPGAYDSTREAVFSADRDERAEWIVRVLDRAGFDPSYMDRRVKLPPRDTTDFLEWIGAPVSGVQHKWEDSLIRYRAIRSDPQSHLEYRVELARAALDILDEQTSLRITPDLFDERVDVIGSEEVADLLGGGSFESALRAAKVDTGSCSQGSGAGSAGSSGTGQGSGVDFGGRATRHQEFSEAEATECISAAAEEQGEPLTVRSYGAWRSQSDLDAPSASGIQYRFGGWDAACEAAGVDPHGHGREEYTDSELLEAIEEAAAVSENNLTVEEYGRWRGRQDAEQPSVATITSRIGWAKAKELAGVE